MSSGVTRISDLIVPAIFTPTIQQQTELKSRLIQSGALVTDQQLNAQLAGAGLTFNVPSHKDLDDDADNVSSDDPSSKSSPNKIGTATEIQVRLSRNNSWSTMDLASDLATADPAQAIASRLSGYWARRLQAAFIATMKGVYANNNSATDAYHTKDDMLLDISSTAYSKGVTDFNGSAFIDTTLTMGDSMEDLTMIMVHSVVYAKMLKNNMITFIPVSINDQVIQVASYLGREVIVDDSMPNTGGVFESWLFARGAVKFGSGSPKVPTETTRDPSAGNGSGQEILFNRHEWAIHPVGHAYVGTAPAGGPSNAATTNNLAAAGSWRRVYTERKQIKMAKLITREY